LELLAVANGWLDGADYRTIVESGKHRLEVDEPVQLQGGDTGPDPYTLVLSALVSCTAITLKMYAGRKNWPLENAHVSCQLSRQEPGRIPQIERLIRLEGDLDEEQKQRLLQIADACPVHKLLSAGTVIHSSLRV
jgi:putative redox protein